jgi:hypothetical protein
VPKLHLIEDEGYGPARKLTVRWRHPLGVGGSERTIAEICGHDGICPVGRDGRPADLTLEPAGPGRARVIRTHSPGIRLIVPEGSTDFRLQAWTITVGAMPWWRWALWTAFLVAAAVWLRAGTVRGRGR